VSVARGVVHLIVLSLLSGCVEGRDVVLGALPFGDAGSGTEDSAPDTSSSADAGSLSDAVLPETGSDTGSCPPGAAVTPTMRALLDERIGFGASANGGENGCVYRVTSLADAGLGSLREGAESVEPLWIVFDVEGDIELSSAIQFGSNKTVDGRGAAVRVRNYGFTISAGDSNVIVTNLTFIGNRMGSNNDAFQIADAAQKIWIDHCDLSNYGDGLIDITHGATEVTVSWSVFSVHRFAVLIGRHEMDTEDVNIRVTLHHNWWNQTESYAPRLRFGRVHLYNNFIDRWQTSAAAVTMGGEIYSESNIFVAASDKQALATAPGQDAMRGRAKSIGDALLGDATTEPWEADQVFNPPYRYVASPANDILQADIVAHAGPRR
jgi:pectate lyase